MLALAGYLFCGLLIGIASVVSGRMRLQQTAVLVGGGMIGALIVSLFPYLDAPQDEVRAAIADQGMIVMWFFLALVAACAYLGLQMLEGDVPDELKPLFRRWENVIVTLGALTLILALATTRLTLAG